MEDTLVIALFFFIIAVVYSSVGFGGGSSYLAILALAGADIFFLRSAALLCNIVVVTSGTIIFYERGYLNIAKVWPLLLLSVPMAFVGGYWPIDSRVIFIILGSALILAAIMMLARSYRRADFRNEVTHSKPLAAGIGGFIGLLSGLVGIGGGIFLAPVLHLLKWERPKQIAAITSVFILINSIAGLLGQWSQKPPDIEFTEVWPLVVAVFLGGQIGTRLSTDKFKSTTVQKTTAVLILFAGIKILNDHWFENLFLNGQ